LSLSRHHVFSDGVLLRALCARGLEVNFIYFNPDEMRGDLLGCYGHPLAKTPNFDQFAAQGTRFHQCHVQHTVCTPSRCSFTTGWYPHTRGHRTLWHCLRPDEPNTLKYLKQSGYDVHWIGKNDLLAAESFADSVTEVHRPGRAGTAGNAFGPDEPGHWSFLYNAKEGGTAEALMLEQSIDFLNSRRAGDPPFMLFLPWGMPHCPYTAPEPWYSMYDPDDIPPLRPADLAGKPSYFEAIRKYRRLDECDEALLRKIMAVYLGMISYVDHLFGRLMAALEETGLADSTTVFMFSDHGDWSGDYGLVEKWPSALDDCLTRIPMIVRTPGGTPGHVVSDPIECFDIMPTTLELAGVDARHTHFARSMVPQLHGAPGDPGRAVFAEGGYDLHEPHCFEGKDAPQDIGGYKNSIYGPKGVQQQERPETVCRSTMIRTATHKLVRRPADQHELYDLVADPQELHNRYGDDDLADVQQQLLERMLDWYVQTGDSVPFDTDSRGFTEGIVSDAAGRKDPAGAR
jgi:arylsulfatase A-like enzyme